MASGWPPGGIPTTGDWMEVSEFKGRDGVLQILLQLRGDGLIAGNWVRFVRFGPFSGWDATCPRSTWGKILDSQRALPVGRILPVRQETAPTWVERRTYRAGFIGSPRDLSQPRGAR